MIWIWINSIAVLIKRMFAFPEIPETYPVIDINRQCPACGHRNGKLYAVQRNGKFLVRHDCQVCFAQFFDLPVDPVPVVSGSATKLDTPAEKKE